MTISTIRNGGELTVIPEGRIDTRTAPELEKALSGESEGVSLITVDFSRVGYISSAGLRVLLVFAQRMEDRGGSLRAVNVSGVVRESFEITGFLDILNVE